MERNPKGTSEAASPPPRLVEDHPVLDAPAEPLLSTMNRDGSRHWIHPRLSRGRYHSRRRALAYALIALFAALPFVSIGGKPAILLDLVNRKFTFFGTTFLPTDSFLLLTLTLGLVLGIFLFTALWGRLWCGWACTQTVYMEFVFRPIDRRVRSRVLKYALFTLISLAMALVFIAYFVGVDPLLRTSPFDHPVRTAAILITAALILFNFGYFREQTCTIACPYGRFQSVLLDRRSLIVGYDPARGEPRGKGRKREALGDCIDCGACVATCPTGIDIRQGLQMECVNCAQCIDACDRIMERLGKSRGLIRYLPQESNGSKPVRVRVLVYSALLLLVAGGFGWSLLGKRDAEVSILRNDSSPWRMMGNDEVASLYRIRIRNATETPQKYTITIHGNDQARLVCPSNPMPIDGLQQETVVVFVVLPRNAANREVTMTVTDGREFTYSKKLRLSGPQQ